MFLTIKRWSSISSELLSRVAMESTASKAWITSVKAISHPISGSSTESEQLYLCCKLLPQDLHMVEFWEM